MDAGGSKMPGRLESVKPGTFADSGIRTLSNIYDFAIENYSTAIAMKKRHSWGYQSISYQEFGKLISFLGSGLMSKGLKKGDRIALMAGNSPEWVVMYAAITACGAVVVPLDTNLRENELKHVLLHSMARFLVVSPKIYHDLVKGAKVKDVDIIVLGEQDSTIETMTVTEIMAAGKEIINNGDTAFFSAKAEVRPEDIAAICYTSGTTGNSKAAVLLQSNLVANIESLMSRLPITSDDIFLCMLPLHHTFSSMCVFLVPVMCGSTIVFARSKRPDLILKDVMQEGITILVAVPLLFEHLAPMLIPVKSGKKRGVSFFKKIFLGMVYGLGKLVGKKMEKTETAKKLVSAGLKKIRFCASGGAALRSDVENAFFDAGIPVLQGYGLTETSPVCAINPFEKPVRGSIGPPLPGIDMKIDTPDADGIGEILVKGANVMKEYYKNPEATQAVLRGGYFYTGDLGRVDDEGYFTIVGRIKSLIVTAGGKNIYPDELEAMLNRNPYILENIVIAVEDRKGNTRPGAIVVPNYDAIGSVPELSEKLTDETIREFIGTEVKKIFADLPDYKRILDFQVRNEELPKTSTRKVKRHMVKWIKA